MLNRLRYAKQNSHAKQRSGRKRGKDGDEKGRVEKGLLGLAQRTPTRLRGRKIIQRKNNRFQNER